MIIVVTFMYRFGFPNRRITTGRKDFACGIGLGNNYWLFTLSAIWGTYDKELFAGWHGPAIIGGNGWLWFGQINR